MAGRSVSEMLGTRGLSGPATPGARLNPTWQPSPNSEPAGAKTGAPPRTQNFSRQVIPYSAVEGHTERTQLVNSEPTNRLAILRAPAIGYGVFVGDANVTPANGLQLPSNGNPYEIPLVGLQELYAVTDAPGYVPVQVTISIILAAEQQRKL